MSSTLNSPIPRRTGTPGRGSGSLAPEKPPEIDYLVNPEAYFSKLESLKTHAETSRKQDLDQEKTLMEYLPVNEKFNLNKEGKVIARWQERQRDWEQIQAKIQRKLTSKVKKPLMMATADEYRARMEEYDLLQAAVPLKDRFSSSSWQVMLRGGGPIRVAVGHIFSGIECEVDLELPRPKMVRKPKPAQAVSKNDTFVDQTSNYLHKAKKYQETMKEIRPHNLTYQEANTLVIKSQSLFKWAKESSAQYYNEQKGQETDIAAEAAAQLTGLTLEASIASSAGAAGGEPQQGSKIDFLSPKEVVFDCLDGKNCIKEISFHNSGSTAISFKWRRIPIPSAVKNDIENTSLNGVLNAKGTDDGALRARMLVKNRECFFCLREVGVILPDETVSSQFIFRSCTGGGSFSSDWILEFHPEETVIYDSAANGVGGGAGAAGAAGSPHSPVGGPSSVAPSPASVGSMSLRLKGHCITVDESATKRAELQDFLDRRAVDAVARDIFFSCLRRVRDPVRLPDLQNRQIAFFRRQNAELLNTLSSRFTTMMPLFITPQRLEMFVQLFHQTNTAVSDVRTALTQRRAQYAALPSESIDLSVVDVGEVDMFNPLVMTTDLQKQIREVLFPEETIEIFDEVTEQDLLPEWSYGLGAVLETLESLLQQCHEVSDLEDKIAEIEKATEKARLKAERLAARMAALESDDELDPDEEEEEEEEEVDEEDRPEKPVHPFVAHVQSLVSELHSTLYLLLTHPLPESEIYSIASELIGEMAESVVDHHMHALEVCELKDMVVTHNVVLPTLPSPFSTEEGAAAWEHALAQTSHIAEPEGGGKKAPPKPAKNAPPPTEPTKQQVDFFYKTLYDGVQQSLLNTGVDVFSRVDTALQKSAIAPFKKYNASLENLFHVAVPRKDDVSSGTAGKVAFVSIDGCAFSKQESVLSAFDVKQENKRRAIAPVLKLIELGAKAIVLIYESPFTIEDPTVDAVLPFFEEMKALLSQQRAEFIAKTNKELKKMKQKPPQYKELVFSKYSSFAEFYYHADALLKEDDSGSTKTGLFNLNIPIILIENTLYTGVIPPEPQLEDEVSDEDEAPVLLGVEENAVKRQQDWESRRPHRVQVTLDLTGPTNTKRSSSSKQPPTIKVECYADAPAAILEAYQIMSAKFNGAPLWVDGAMGKFFDPITTLPMLDASKITQRFASEEMRESCLWSGVLQLMPSALEHLQQESASPPPSAAAVENEPSSGADAGIETTTSVPAPSPSELIAKHFVKVFPYSAQSKTAPVAVVVLGGNIRAEKFAVLDQLIDLVETIFLVGEFSLPFLCLSKRYQFRRYQECAKYHSVCSSLLAKARMRGCRLRWPVDMVMGDMEINSEERLKCFVKFEVDSRNEGADYEGEAKVFKVSDSEIDAGGVDPILLSGFAYDLGPETCAALKTSLQQADLVVVWGTAGVCESSAFQAGQHCLVEFSSTKPLPEASPVKAAPASGAKGAPAASASAAATEPALTKNPQRTVLIGDATVEWFARMLDSDGELAGDLVGAGMVSYATRKSSVFAGLMGLFPSRMMQGGLSRRAPLDSEFEYKRVRPLEEDDDDEEEEEEDEDD